MNKSYLKNKIVTHAYTLFMERGIRGVTMDQISSSLSISKRTLYEEFPSKEILLNEVMAIFLDQRRELGKDIVRRDITPIEKIFLLTSITLERSDSEKLFIYDLIVNYSHLLHKNSSIMNEVLDGIKDLIIEGCDAGYFYNNLNIDFILNHFFDTRINYANTIPICEMVELHKFGTIFFLRSISNEKGINEVNKICKNYNIPIIKN